ncbi:hypothetical protein [Haloferax volcanii]|nr:hypothetical protein [Haloferax volcanii]
MNDGVPLESKKYIPLFWTDNFVAGIALSEHASCPIAILELNE